MWWIVRIAIVVLVVLVTAMVASADEKADARTAIAKQLEQIKKGDVEGLKAGFTERQRSKITADMVKQAADTVSKMTIDDLVGSASMETKGQLKIKMKNGRTLTTLVLVKGTWLADTLWFK